MGNVSEPSGPINRGLTVDEIGPWSEVKLQILRRYAATYSKILASQSKPRLKHIYIDAFAGGGIHWSRKSREFVPGSPVNALLIEPPFHEYHFVELNPQKAEALHELAGERKDVFIYKGDCNQVLLEKVFPRARWGNYARALCLLDPYGLHLSWEVIAAAGQSRAIEVFINFPILDINRNVLRKNPADRDPAQEARLTFFWGDDTWKNIAYESRPTLFGDQDEKVTNEELAQGFRERLRAVAGFKEVPEPCAMRNTRNAVVYYLYFASEKSVASDIVRHIFENFGRT